MMKNDPQKEKRSVREDILKKLRQLKPKVDIETRQMLKKNARFVEILKAGK